MPIPVYNVICVLSAACAGVVAFNLFKDLKGKDIIASIIILAVCVGFSLLRIHTGAVKKEFLEENKKAIIIQALADDERVIINCIQNVCRILRFSRSDGALR